MTVRQLYSQLEDIIHAHLSDDSDMDIKMAHQPSWPFQFDIARAEVVDFEEIEREEYNEEKSNLEPIELEEFPEFTPSSTDKILYLVEGHQEYLRGPAARAIGW